MPEPIAENNLYEFLTAYADGELDAAQSLAVLEQLCARPELVAFLRDQQRLRLETRRVVLGEATAASEAMRRRIEALAPARTPASNQAVSEGGGAAATGTGAFELPPVSRATFPRQTGPAHPWWRRRAVAASFLLLAGMAVGALVWPLVAPKPGGQAETGSVSRVVPAQLVSATARMHVDCSRIADRLHASPYPSHAGDLADAVKADLASNDPFPDLSSIGYRFVGTGPCPKPIEGAVHLLYRRQAPGDVAEPISVVVERNTGQFSMDAGKLYEVATAADPVPMLAWRTDRVIYLLMAEDPGVVAAARAAIRAAPAPSGR